MVTTAKTRKLLPRQVARWLRTPGFLVNQFLGQWALFQLSGGKQVVNATIAVPLPGHSRHNRQEPHGAPDVRRYSPYGYRRSPPGDATDMKFPRRNSTDSHSTACRIGGMSLFWRIPSGPPESLPAQWLSV